MSTSFARAPDGTQLYVRQRQQSGAVTAVLCDGLVCDGFIYKYLWEDLAGFGPVAHWHYRGHGRSSPPKDRTRLRVPDHAADLDSVRRHLGDPPVVLVGHSLGVQVVLEAYRLRPSRVVGLVLLCGTFGRVTHTFKHSDMLASVLPAITQFCAKHPRLARLLWGAVPVKAALRMAQLTGDIDLTRVSARDVEPYFEHVTRVDVELFLGMLEAAGEHSAEDLLPQIAVPTLVVAGARDSFTPAALSEAMAEAIPGARLLLFPDGTHIAPLEHREQVAQAIGELLLAAAPP